MQHRIGLFILVATAIGLCAATGRSVAASYEAMYAALPGGAEALPGFTSAMLAVLKWLGAWWWICVLVAGGALLGGPGLLERTEAGRRLLGVARDWMGRYSFLVFALYIAFMFTVLWAIDYGLELPMLQIIDALSHG